MCNDLDLKFDQNLVKLNFYIILIIFYIIMIEISFKNGSKRFKLIKNNLITYTHVTSNCVQKINL